jgi:hypothetical protein
MLPFHGLWPPKRMVAKIILHHLRRSRIDAGQRVGVTAISTGRFWARPVAVAFVMTGSL